MGAPLKLSDADVKKIRRRVRAGEQQTLIAVEYRVNRKTIRRRLDELERTEREREANRAHKRLRRQAARERKRLGDREALSTTELTYQRSAVSEHDASVSNPHSDWLDTRKNLSGRALAEANGRIRVRLPDGSFHRWVDRSVVEALLDSGWILDD